MNHEPIRPDAAAAAVGADPSTWESARADLARWRALQPDNHWRGDHALRRLLTRLMPEDRLAAHVAHFDRFGAVVAGPLDAAAIVNNLTHNLPVLDRWSPYGERIEAIAHHPSYQDCGRHIYQDGEVIAAYADDEPHVRALALFYLSSHAGEAGHNCPVACTAGVVKALSHAGSDALKERYLPGLLRADFPERLDGAQFMTEIQGGSDVGANAVVARPDGEALGTTRWRIHGEKWFCSNAAADLILMTARVEGARADGTAGLGLFLVPRKLDDGRINHFHIRRLKDKLGTRSMASGEIDFDGAVAYAIGPVERGFRTMMTQVIHTSRLYNTVGVAGLSHRAFLVARAYAQARQAFGGPILRFPLVAEMVADMRARSHAVLAGALDLAAGLDAHGAGRLADADLAWLRVGTNLAKMRSCQHSHRVVLTAIETLGGNGAIESFSVLPRFLRDNVVYENWEGTHNTLVAQTHRDFAKHGLHEGVIATLRRKLKVGDPRVQAAVAPVVEALDVTARALPAILRERDPGLAAYLLRPHAERLADCLFAAAMAEDVASEPDPARRQAEVETLRWFVGATLATTPAFASPELAERARTIAALEG